MSDEQDVKTLGDAPEETVFVLRLPPASLRRKHPPQIHDRNKQTIFEMCTAAAAVDGESEAAAPVKICVSKHRLSADGRSRLLDGKFSSPAADNSSVEKAVLSATATTYTYEPSCDQRCCPLEEGTGKSSGNATGELPCHSTTAAALRTRRWYVNFADPSLFVAYGSGMMAQDEIQAAEHPDLASVREALKHFHSHVDSKFAAQTVSGGMQTGPPTPILVENVERRCAFDTSKLYGNRFQRASVAEVRDAVRVLAGPARPGKLTNFICMAALPPGFGQYQPSQIEHLFVTALISFRAAVRRTADLASGEDGANPFVNESPSKADGARTTEGVPSAPDDGVSWSCIIHTGNWGCGAFGGNKRLMAAVQIAAAYLSGAKLVYHTFDAHSLAEFELGSKLVSSWFHETPLGERTIQGFIAHLLHQRFAWGVSDGN